MSDELRVRPATDADLPQVLALLQSSLGWVPDEQYAAFFRWKHEDNPFGPSPAWVAVDGERVVGLRIWLRWRFVDHERTYTAVRAVDTATHPEYQGRGIFRRLTLSSLAVLREEGVDFVFNTPNENSRPGYLKMGWEQLGRLPVAVRFRSAMSAVQALRARVPADKWSLPTHAGQAAGTALADSARVQPLLSTLPAGRMRTDLDLEVLRWRYGFGPLHYRALWADGALAFFRLRRRGPSTECVVGHILAADGAGERRLLARLADVAGADQTLQLTRHPQVGARYFPLPGAGPILTWRAVNERRPPALERWGLTMGDVELF